MKDEAKKRLKRILGAYDEKLAETERLEAASRAAKAAFPERFAALKKEMILPVLRELAEMLTGSGHEATAHEQEESSSHRGRRRVGGGLAARHSEAVHSEAGGHEEELHRDHLLGQPERAKDRRFVNDDDHQLRRERRKEGRVRDRYADRRHRRGPRAPDTGKGVRGRVAAPANAPVGGGVPSGGSSTWAGVRANLRSG